MKKDVGEIRHDCLVKILEAELTEKGFDCFTFVEYSNNDKRGEIDLFAIRDTLPPIYQFYEVKCSCSTQRVVKARKQYRKFLEAYELNKSDVEGYMVSYNHPKIRL